MLIIDHDHVIGDNGVTGELTASPVIIEDYVWCGANVRITQDVYIGARAEVTKDVSPKAVVAGDRQKNSLRKGEYMWI